MTSVAGTTSGYKVRLIENKFRYHLKKEPGNLALHDVEADLKNVFWLKLFVGASFQILDPPQADLRFVTHKGNGIRRGIPLCGETQHRRDFEPKSYF